jgi:uncharacterized protein involved in outer membrane biogenesis
MAFCFIGKANRFIINLMNIKKISYQIFLPLLGVLLLTWVLMFVFLPGFIKDQVQAYGQSIGYQITYKDIQVTPWSLRVDLHGVQIDHAPRALNSPAESLLKANHLIVNAEVMPLLLGRVHFSEVMVDGLELRLTRATSKNAPASWNWLDFIKAIQSKKDPEAKPSSLKVKISLFELKNAHFMIDDRFSKTKYDFPHLNLSAKDLANYDHTGKAGAQADYTLHLDTLDLPVPGSANRLKLSSLGLSGHLEFVKQEVLQMQMKVLIDGSAINSKINMDMRSSELAGEINFKDLPLSPFIALLPSNKALVTQKGTASADLKLKTAKKGWSILGDVHFGELAIYEPGEKEALLNWAEANFNQIDLNFLDQQQRRFSIQEITIKNPGVRFEIAQDGRSNFRRMFAKEHNNEIKETTKEITKETAPTQVQLDIKAIKISNGDMYFSDFSLKPQFSTRVRQLNGSLLGVSNVPGQYALIALDGQVDLRGSMRARGQLAFEDPRRNNDLSLTFRNLPMNTMNPYSVTFAGSEIESGRIDVDLKYATKDGFLRGKNQFVINQIKLGKELEDFKGKRLPIRLAISLLEDSDGLIDVNIPVSGNVEAPEFSMGHLVWQAITTVLGNIVTAPFRALGSLFGGDNISGVYFQLGESAITPPEGEKLEKLAALLIKKPTAKLTFFGTYDAKTDRAELARVQADRAILLAAGFKLSDDAPLPTPSLIDPRIQSGLKSAYGSQVGRIKLARQLINLPNTPERWATLRDELIKSYVITDKQLTQLADQRAKNARTVFLKNNPDMADRISIGTAQAIESDASGISLGLSLLK